MTASTTTSNSSRRIDAPVEGASSRDAGTATVRLGGDELSADPFQLFAAGVTNLQTATVGRAPHPHGQPQGLLDVRRQRPKLGTLATNRSARLVGARPVLGLPHGQTAGQHDLQAVRLACDAVERAHSARVAGGYCRP